ncbi:UDP-N-acetylmuramoyl-L-alanyl-D-glutamate--2,6-diaminopimelate ligase, partial [Coprococcus eutactus]|nr:UDP-N-acetylmuramoyl-L-alanyl-D-glutamate--2,6-diaminopimelate ligase [Coprococcus eutactus]
EFASIQNVDLTYHKSYFDLIYGGENREYNTNLIGDYNVENIVAAIISSLLIGIPTEQIRRSIRDIYVPG